MLAWTFKVALNLIYARIASRNKVQTHADVAVVGAGPAGCFAALTAAKLGCEATVFEEHREVGLPNHCAGHISIRGLARLGLHLPQKVIENKIAAAVFYSPSGNGFKVRFSSPVTYVINRSVFDKHLAQLAEKAGARFQLGARVEKLLLDQTGAHGVALKNGEHLESKIVINAEGCASTLLKQTGLQTFDKSLTVSAVNGETDRVEGLEDDAVEVYLGQEFASGLYAWIIPKRDGSAKVGLATLSGNAREHLRRFLSTHRIAKKRMKFTDIRNLSFHVIPLGGPIPKTYHSGFLTVGDAASQVKPTTGGGVIMGLTCAKIAGETASEAIHERSYSEEFLQRYQERWRQAIGFDMRVMRQMRLMLNQLSDRKLDRIISLCRQLRLDEELRKVRDIDFQGGATIRLLKSPSVWTIALYSLFSSLTS